MKIQVRRGVFETNSSSVHSLCMCSKDDYDRWENGELFYDPYCEELVGNSDGIQQDRRECEEKGYQNNYMTYEEFWDFVSWNFDELHKRYKTKAGEEVIAFGYYGHD